MLTKEKGGGFKFSKKNLDDKNGVWRIPPEKNIRSIIYLDITLTTPVHRGWQRGYNCYIVKIFMRGNVIRY